MPPSGPVVSRLRRRLQPRSQIHRSREHHTVTNRVKSRTRQASSTVGLTAKPDQSTPVGPRLMASGEAPPGPSASPSPYHRCRHTRPVTRLSPTPSTQLDHQTQTRVNSIELDHVDVRRRFCLPVPGGPERGPDDQDGGVLGAVETVLEEPPGPRLLRRLRPGAGRRHLGLLGCLGPLGNLRLGVLRPGRLLRVRLGVLRGLRGQGCLRDLGSLRDLGGQVCLRGLRLGVLRACAVLCLRALLCRRRGQWLTGRRLGLAPADRSAAGRTAVPVPAAGAAGPAARAGRTSAGSAGWPSAEAGRPSARGPARTPARERAGGPGSPAGSPRPGGARDGPSAGAGRAAGSSRSLHPLAPG